MGLEILPQNFKYFSNVIISVISIVYLYLNSPDIQLCIPAIYITGLTLFSIELLSLFYYGWFRSKKVTRGVRPIVSCVCQFAICVSALYLIIVLFGAPVLSQLEETLSLSVLLAALCLGRAFLAVGPSVVAICATANRSTSWEQSEVETRFIYCLVGAWLGAFPIPLDWDRSWQTWPLTCVIGALFGEVFCNFRLFSLRQQTI